MKRYLSILLIVCLVSGTFLPRIAFAMGDTPTLDNTQDAEDAPTEEHQEDENDNTANNATDNTTDNTTDNATDDITDNTTDDSEGVTEQKDDEADNTEKEENTDNNELDEEKDEKTTNPDDEDAVKDDTVPEDENTDKEKEKDDDEKADNVEDEKENEPAPEHGNTDSENNTSQTASTQDDSVFLNIHVDSQRNINISSSPEIFYAVIDDEDTTNNIFIMFYLEDSDTEITEDEIFVIIPELWDYEINMDQKTVTIIPFDGKIYVSVDEYRNVTVKTLSSIYYEVLDKDGEGNIEVMFFLDNSDIELDEESPGFWGINEDEIIVYVPELWDYEIDMDRLSIMLKPQQLTFERPEIIVTADEERYVTVVVPVGIEYEVIDKDGEGNINIMFFSDDPDMEIYEDEVVVNVPEMWSYEINVNSLTVILIPQQLIAESALVTITVDDKRDVTVIAPVGVEYEVTDSDDRDSIYVSLNVVNPEIEISEDDIAVEVPPNWSYVIDVDSLIITITPFVEKTEFTFEELVEMGAIEVVGSNPRVRSVYDQIFIIHELARINTWETLRQAVTNATQNATSPTLIQLTSNITSTASAIEINNGRWVHLEPLQPGMPWILTQNRTTGDWWSTPAAAETFRHFQVLNGHLQIRDIILDGNFSASLFRGGVYVNGPSSKFTMLEGSVIRNCHANHGGAVNVRGGATADLLGGEIRNNVVNDYPTWRDIHVVGLGGGVHVDTGATLTTKNVRFTENKSNNWGGAIDLHDRAVARIGEGTLIDNNTAHNGGGGAVLVWNNSTLIMDGGEIMYNRAPEGGGVVLVNTAGTMNDTSSFTLNDGIIAHNTATIQGGGISGLDIRASYAPGTFYAQLIQINGGRIYDNKAPVGGGIFVSTGTLETNGGEIHSNESLTGTGTGGGVYWMGGSWTGTGTNIYGNKASQYGGGVAALGAGTRTLSSSVNIYGNDAIVGGGGIYVENGTGFILNSGTIKDNTANDGGGLFIPINNRRNVTIDQGVSFTGNTARNGIRIEDTAVASNPQINPGTVSLTWLGSNGHAFTNYDINTQTQGTTTLYQVTFEVGTGTGEITAMVNSTETTINNGDFVPGGTQIIFSADPEQRLDQWDVGTKNDINAQFVFTDGGVITPLTLTINAHTQVIANFKVVLFTTLTVTKKITGVTANLSKIFDFTITFTGPDGVTPLPAGTQFSYIGDVIPGLGATAPQNGALILDSTGSAKFALGHGQAIAIQDVPHNGHVQIIEDPAGYTASFTDSENAQGGGSDTTMLAMAENRIISFVNELEYIPPTGVDVGDMEGLMLLTTLVSLAVMPVFTLRIVNRKRKPID